jgi:hypothetical protein
MLEGRENRSCQSHRKNKEYIQKTQVVKAAEIFKLFKKYLMKEKSIIL